MKPTRGELRSCLEVLAKKKRSVKQKPSSSSEGCPSARGKILKVGASSSPEPAVRARGSSGRENEPPLKVLPISVWSPTSQGVAPPLVIPDEVTGNRDRFEAARDEDSLLSHAELAVGAVSSILRDFDLRRVDALPIEDVQPLYVQVLSSIFLFIVSVLLADLFFFFCKWLLTRKAWQGGPALPWAPPLRRSLTRLRLLP